MSRSQRALLILLCGSVLIPAAPALADEWYVGAAVAIQTIQFKPEYTFTSGAPPAKFHNRATGPGLLLSFGQRYLSGNRFSMGWQGTFGVNGVDWSLSIPSEPAELKYSIPAFLTASFVPEVRLGGPRSKISVFGSAGEGVAHVQQLKTSPSSSTYDVDIYKGILVFGGGVKVRMSERTGFIAGFDYLRTLTYTFDTFTPAGVMVERVEDAARAHAVSFGVTTKF